MLDVFLLTAGMVIVSMTFTYIQSVRLKRLTRAHQLLQRQMENCRCQVLHNPQPQTQE